MSLINKLHQLSIHALNFCAVATLISLAINVLSAVTMFIMDHKRR